MAQSVGNKLILYDYITSIYVTVITELNYTIEETGSNNDLLEITVDFDFLSIIRSSFGISN